MDCGLVADVDRKELVLFKEEPSHLCRWETETQTVYTNAIAPSLILVIRGTDIITCHSLGYIYIA